MFQVNVKSGSKTVVITSNTGKSDFSARLYVGGEEMIASTQTAKAKTLKGIKRSALRLLGNPAFVQWIDIAAQIRKERKGE